MAWRVVLWTLGFLTCSSHHFLTGPPSCLIPPQKSIHCHWSPDTHTGPHATYTLHWRIDGREDSVVASARGGCVPRRSYGVLDDVCVWVTVTLETHTLKSPQKCFNAIDIEQPPAPRVQGHMWEDGAVGVQWSWGPEGGGEHCSSPERRRCNLRYCSQCPPGPPHWTLKEGVSLSHFQVDEPLPFTWYQFQVSCTCVEVMSPWSNTYTLRSPEAAPVGKVDVWKDCGSSSSRSSCNITWKVPEASLLRGQLLAFELLEEVRNGSVRRRNLTSATQHHAVRLGDATAVCVSARTAEGVTEPACLSLLQHTDQPPAHLTVRADKQGLTASWTPPTDLSEHVQEYVVQRQRAGLPYPDGFDWTRVNKDMNWTLLTGHFKNCTPYEVSLFAILQGNQSRLMASTVAFYRQCAPPPEVPMLEVSPAHDSALVSWIHPPLKDTHGYILCYRLELNGKEHIVGAQHTQWQVRDLQPGQKYGVSIRAETGAGVGISRNVTFTTTARAPGSVLFLVPIILVCVVLCGFPAVLCMRMPRVCHCGYVPDPGRSKLLREQPYYPPLPILKCSPVLPDKMGDLYPLTPDLLCPESTKLEPGIGKPWGSQPKDLQQEQEWLHIPMEKETQQEEQECGFCRREEYRDSRALEGDEEEEEKEEEEEEGSYDDGWDREREEEEEEEDWFLSKPDTDYEKHMPV